MVVSWRRRRPRSAQRFLVVMVVVVGILRWRGRRTGLLSWSIMWCGRFRGFCGGIGKSRYGSRTAKCNSRWPAPNSSKVKWNSSCDDKEAVLICLSCLNDLAGLRCGDGRGWMVGSGVVARGGGEAARGDIGERRMLGGACHYGLE